VLDIIIAKNRIRVTFSEASAVVFIPITVALYLPMLLINTLGVCIAKITF
jgi:hypothetical protein